MMPTPVIDDSLLLDKLKEYGVPFAGLQWVKRRQTFIFIGSFSKIRPVPCGVPQDS